MLVGSLDETWKLVRVYWTTFSGHDLFCLLSQKNPLLLEKQARYYTQTLIVSNMDGISEHATMAYHKLLGHGLHTALD